MADEDTSLPAVLAAAPPRDAGALRAVLRSLELDESAQRFGGGCLAVLLLGGAIVAAAMGNQWFALALVVVGIVVPALILRGTRAEHRMVVTALTTAPAVAATVSEVERHVTHGKNAHTYWSVLVRPKGDGPALRLTRSEEPKIPSGVDAWLFVADGKSAVAWVPALGLVVGPLVTNAALAAASRRPQRTRAVIFYAAVAAILTGAAYGVQGDAHHEAAELGAHPVRTAYADGPGVFVGRLDPEEMLPSPTRGAPVGGWVVEVSHVVEHHSRRSDTTRRVLDCSMGALGVPFLLADGPHSLRPFGDGLSIVEADDPPDYVTTHVTSRTVRDVDAAVVREAALCEDPRSRFRGRVRVATWPIGARLEVVGCGVGGELRPCHDGIDRVTDGHARRELSADARGSARTALYLCGAAGALALLFATLALLDLRRPRDPSVVPVGAGVVVAKVIVALAVAGAAAYVASLAWPLVFLQLH